MIQWEQGLTNNYGKLMIARHCRGIVVYESVILSRSAANKVRLRSPKQYDKELRYLDKLARGRSEIRQIRGQRLKIKDQELLLLPLCQIHLSNRRAWRQLSFRL